MKKTLLALAVLAGVATAATAQTPNAERNAACTPGATCTPAATNCEAGRDAACPNPFEGLNLTAEQQTALAALRNECRADRDSCRAEAKRARLARIKEILTPEQYVTFLENAFVNSPGRSQARPGRDGHRTRHGVRTERNARAAAHPAREARTPVNNPAGR